MVLTTPPSVVIQNDIYNKKPRSLFEHPHIPGLLARTLRASHPEFHGYVSAVNFTIQKPLYLAALYIGIQSKEWHSARSLRQKRPIVERPADFHRDFVQHPCESSRDGTRPGAKTTWRPGTPASWNIRAHVVMCSSGGLAVKRITSNDEIPGSSPGRSFSIYPEKIIFASFLDLDQTEHSLS
jgi:hypothetical protein